MVISFQVSVIYFLDFITLEQWCLIVLKELDNGNYEQELSAINEVQQCLYQALKALEID